MSALPTPEPTRWLSTTEFAGAAGITPQAARRALQGALKGRPWRERQLKVRHVLGAGGRGGLGYEVSPASLPPELTISAPVISEAVEPSVSAARFTAKGQDRRLLDRAAPHRQPPPTIFAWALKTAPAILASESHTQ